MSEIRTLKPGENLMEICWPNGFKELVRTGSDHLFVTFGPPQKTRPPGHAVLIEGRWWEIVSAIDELGREQCAHVDAWGLDILEKVRPQTWLDRGEILSESLSQSIEWIDSDSSYDWLVDGLIPRNAVTILGAAPKAGKTRMAIQIALAVSTGRPLLGRYATRRGGVLAYLLEDPTHDRNLTIARSCAGLGIDEYAAQSIPFRLVPSDTRLRLDIEIDELAKVTEKTDEDLSMFVDELDRLEPALVIFDSLRRFHRQDENSSEKMAPVLEMLRHIARRASVLVIHHNRAWQLGDERKAPGELLRGTTDLRAVARSIIGLRREKHGLVLSVEGNNTPLLSVPIRTTEDPRVIRFELADQQASAGTAQADDLVLAELAKGAATGAELERLLRGRVKRAPLRKAIKDLAAAQRMVATEVERPVNGHSLSVAAWKLRPSPNHAAALGEGEARRGLSPTVQRQPSPNESHCGEGLGEGSVFSPLPSETTPSPAVLAGVSAAPNVPSPPASSRSGRVARVRSSGQPVKARNGKNGAAGEP